MKISKMANRIEPSLTRKLFDMAKKYDNVIDFTLGDPDYETPDYVKKAACDAIMAGKTKYAANAGIIELRKAAAKRIERETGISYDPNTEIQISVGAMEGLFLTLCCLVDPGDEVIIPSPHWVNYKHMTEILNGVPVLVAADEDHDFVVTAEEVADAVTDKTVAIIINSPNNPTGTVYDKETLEKICQVLDVAPEYIRDLTGGLDWLTGEETRLNYAFHLYQGASLYKGTAELLKTVYINPAKLSKRQMDSAMDKFYELACRIRSEIEKDDSKKSSV